MSAGGGRDLKGRETFPLPPGTGSRYLPGEAGLYNRRKRIQVMVRARERWGAAGLGVFLLGGTRWVLEYVPGALA
jgi:hypothetical protein